MRCDRARERFQEYIEGALRGHDLRALEEHLRSCQSCRNELEGLRELDARLREEVPKYWGSIKPSPGFIARLEQVKLGAPARGAPKLVESLLISWQRHRQALAIAFSICLVVALALIIPRVIPPVEEAPLFTEELSQPRMEEEVAEEAPMEGIIGMEAEGSKVGPPESEAASAKAMVVPAPAPAIGGYTAEEEKRAIEIALRDSKVQEVLQSKNYHPLKVQESTYEEDFSWTGPTVIIALEEAEPPGALLYVWVDLDKEKVVKVLLKREDQH